MVLFAHLVQTGFGGFYDGMAHWALSPRDVLVTLALTVLGILGGLKTARGIAPVLPLAWLAGGLVGFARPELGGMPLATTLTVSACGLLAALDRPPRGWPAMLLAGLCGAAHGLANGAVMVSENRQAITLIGTVTAVALVVLLGSGLLRTPEKPAGRVVLRVAGSWMAAIALLLVGWLFRPV